MKRFIIFFFLTVIAGSCTTKQQYLHQPEPGYADSIFSVRMPFINDITETKAGPGNENMPQWLIVYLNGGIPEVEKMEYFYDRYCFIGRIEGTNFNALNKWAGFFSLVQDFPKLAAARIEKRLVSAASYYPDDEYGLFYELMIKNAFDTEYPDAFSEDTFWIKKIVNQNEITQIYEFFVFVSIDKISMQAIIENMMEETFGKVTPTRVQINAIRRMQQIFFTEF